MLEVGSMHEAMGSVSSTIYSQAWWCMLVTLALEK